ncbi:acyltransferase family protein [Hirschia maritima]|uniref:acyltransferase family protein n=1 Tax=Hirschia maritima TaxID=1121961 RepID=UPI000364C9A4|nr:acyltransferase [Hirschia maritima]
MHNVLVEKATKNLKSWLICILVLFLLGAITTPTANVNSIFIEDADIEKSGDWRVVNLFGRYTEGRASFTGNVNSTGSVNFDKEKTAERVVFRIYDYGKNQVNIANISLGDQKSVLKYGAEKAGVTEHTVTFPEKAIGNKLDIQIDTLEQPSFLIDSIVLEAETNSFDYSRIFTRGLLFAFLGFVLWAATIFTTTPTVSTGRIYSSIDLFRGIGVLLVVALHATGFSGLPNLTDQPMLDNLSKHGHFGVEIFYVVSAYTLTFSLYSASQNKSTSIVSQFWSRRVVRIIPAFAAVFFLAVVLKDFLPSKLETNNILTTAAQFASMSYIFERDVLLAPIGHSVWWSISTEFQFYIVMPLLFLPIFASLKMQTINLPYVRYILAGSLALIGILISAYSRSELVGKPWLPYTLFYHIDAFLIGIALGILSLKTKSSSENEKLPFKQLSLWGGLGIASYVLVLGAVGFSTQLGELLSLPRNFVPARLGVIIICAGGIYLARRAEDKGFNFSGFAGLRTVGLLSFLIYLIHVPAMELAARIPVPSSVGNHEGYYHWVLLIGLGLSVIASVILHQLVERPSLKLNVIAKTRSWFPTTVGIFIGWIIFCFLINLATH